MDEYIKDSREAEFALNNGEYYRCTEIIKPYIDVFSPSSKEGINIRMILITAYSGINKKDEALKICKQLAKSKSSLVRENAKSLFEILNAPDLKTPENWNIKFENDIKDINKSYESKPSLRKFNKEEQFIKISENPTGETKPLKKGFAVLTIFLLILLVFLLSGCVKIQNNIDLRDINFINMNLSIESKYLGKIPWQINFEKEISENFNNSIINFDNDKFLIKEEGLSLIESKNKLNKIIEIASRTTPIKLKNIEINHSEKDYFLLKKHFFSIILNLIELDNNDIDISINIISPSKPKVLKQIKNIKILGREISWELISGEINQIEFTYWDWNKLIFSLIITSFIVLSSYFLKVNRYELGSDLPKLPS